MKDNSPFTIERTAEVTPTQPAPVAQPAFHACDLGDGRAMLYDKTGYAWGVYANPSTAFAIAAKLSE